MPIGELACGYRANTRQPDRAIRLIRTTPLTVDGLGIVKARPGMILAKNKKPTSRSTINCCRGLASRPDPPPVQPQAA